MTNIIIYNTPDGESSIALYAKDGSVWLNQSELAELFATSKPNISMHITNILKDNELARSRVHKRSVMHQSIEITKVYDAWLIHPTLAVP